MSRKPRTLAQQVEYEFPAYGPFIRARLVRCILSERRRIMRLVKQQQRWKAVPNHPLGAMVTEPDGEYISCDDLLAALRDKT